MSLEGEVRVIVIYFVFWIYLFFWVLVELSLLLEWMVWWDVFGMLVVCEMNKYMVLFSSDNGEVEGFCLELVGNRVVFC